MSEGYWNIDFCVYSPTQWETQRRRYIITSSLIGWAHTQKDPCCNIILYSYVNPDYMRTANDPKTICQLCEDASPEARALYPTGWCQQIVTKDTSAHSQGKSGGQFNFDEIYTVRCRYNAIIFLQNPYNRRPIARPWGRAMGCLLWVRNQIDVLVLLMHCYK